MGEQFAGRQLRIPTSHYRTQPRTSVRPPPQLPRPIKLGKRQAAERARRLTEALGAITPLSVPRDGVVRAVSSVAAKRPPGHPVFKDFRALVRVYCALALGYSGKHVVQTYLYIKLNQMLDEKKSTARAQAESLTREHIARPQWLQAQLNHVLRPIERADIERMAETIFRFIQSELLAKVSLRQGGDHSTANPQYNARRVQISLGAGSRTAFLIIDASKNKLRVLALKTDAEFKARQRRGIKPKSEYRNTRKRKPRIIYN